MARTYPPNRYPNQLVLQISDDMLDRIEADTAAREDRNRSAATRRLIALGILLADAIAEHGDSLGGLSGARALHDAAKAVR